MNTENVIKNFITGNRPNARTANLYYINNELYSYGSHHVMAKIDRVNKSALVNTRKVSKTTTKHTNKLIYLLESNQITITNL
jgi:hypothetical protein